MYFAYKLNKQGNNIQPWCIPFLTWNQSVDSCPVLTTASWPAYRFLRRQIRWSGTPITWRIFHSLLSSTQSDFGIIKKAEVNVFLEPSRFFNDPTDVDNFVPGSSAFTKTSLNIWKFMFCVLLKPGLENFEHYFASVWDECNWQQFEHSLALPFFEIGMKTNFFQSCGHCWVFQICWHIECSTFRASSFRIWNSSTGISLPPLTLFAVILPKTLLILHSWMSGSRCDHTIVIIWVMKIFFLSSSSVYFCHLFLISSALLGL